MTDIAIKGAKKGQGEARKPSIAKDSVASTSTAKILYGLAEGEVSGLVNGGKSIRLNGTPLLDDAGNSNFEGVTWDFRAGTNDQEYIKGFPDVSNETPINVELTSAQPWVKAFTDTQLSAVRVRFKWDRLSKTNPDNGDITGYKIQYAIDLQTNGGAYVEVLNTKIEDKTSAGYERTHRIDLPKSTTGWQIRVRRLTANDDSEYVQDTMVIDAVAEVIDVKLRYPNTALLGVQYNAETFSSIAKLEAHVRGSIIRVPSNYDAVARTYTGIWDGTFKDAYSNNPAWVYFDLCTQWRYGLGERLDITMIDKWSLYTLGQYCDQMVSDGQGGLEPRFTCNVYLQKQVDAYQVLQNIGGIFRAMSYWNGEQIVLDADVPQDPVYTFSRANVVDGNFEYTGTRQRDRHTLAKVAWDNPINRFETEYEYIRDEKAMAKFGVKVLDLSAFGCTSQAQAQRAGLWALKTEQLETRQVSFAVGLDGFIPQVGNIVNVSDELFAGRANGGRVSIVSITKTVITIDRDITVNAGDVLIVNGSDGKSERRTVQSATGRDITVTVAFDNSESENVWAIETPDLKLMRFRVMSIMQNDDATFNITGIQHEPQKYDAIDFGADVKPTAITIVNPDTVDAPTSVTITSRHREVQGQMIATLIIGWSQVLGAVAYDVEWRKDDGTWIKVPRTGNVSVDIEGVYSGNYLARVRAVSAFEVQSQSTTSILTVVAGKIGLPPTIVGLTATGILFGMDLKWSFAIGSGDAAYTEIETGSAPDVNVSMLGQYSYPTNTHTINGLQGNLPQSYRARLVDKLGFVSPWSAWVTGTTDASANKVLDLLNGQIAESQLFTDLGAKIAKIEPNEASLTVAKADIITAKSVADSAKSDAAANKTEITSLSTTVGNNKTSVDNSIITLTNKDTSLTNSLNTLTSTVDSNKASVVTDITTLTNKDISLTNSLNSLTTTVNTNTASITSEATTRANADSAITATANTLRSEYDANKASVTSSLTTLTNKDTALTNSINSLTSTVNTNTASINSEITTRASADSALSTRIDSVVSSANANTAAITTEQTTRANADSALSTRVDTVQSSTATAQTTANNAATTAGNKGEVIFGSTTPITAKQLAQNLWIDTTGGTNKPKRWDGAAWVIVTDKAAVDAQTAANAAQTTATDALGKANTATSNIATIQTDLSATTSKANATASSVTTLQTTVDGHTSSISTQQSSINGLNAQYTVKVDVGGKVSGFGLASSATQSDFAIRADKFYIAPPTGTSNGTSPFMVLTTPTVINGVTVPTGTYMQSAYIHDGSIDIAKINKASITSLSAISATIGTFKSAETGARLEIKDSLLSVYDANNVLRVRLGIW